MKKNKSATEKTLIIIIKKQKVEMSECYFISKKPIRKKQYNKIKADSNIEK